MAQIDEKLKLNLGCGKDYRIGWVNIDIREKGDKKADFLKLEYKNCSVDAILLSHVAMYIRPELMRKLLAKWFRWLKIGGTIHVETQDLDRVRDPETLYGMGDYAGHQWAWTPETLGKLLEEAGFSVSSVPGILHGKPERDFLLCGKK